MSFRSTIALLLGITVQQKISGLGRERQIGGCCLKLDDFMFFTRIFLGKKKKAS